MKTGSPGFIGARLKEARQARGLTAAALAEIIGVTRSAVSHYERGEQSPRPDVMRNIEETLNLPPQFFWRIPAKHRVRNLFWRSLSAATKCARTMAESRYLWLEDIVEYIREFVDFPSVNFPDFVVPQKPASISVELVEELAGKTRRFWKLGQGAISNVVWLLENNGAIITRTKLEANTLDAFSEWQSAEGRPYFILGADKNVAARSRFDIAHELGHIILHRNVDGVCIGRHADHKLLEQQANRFAGAFLLPEHSFMSDFFSPSLDTFQALKPKWGVSIQLMIHRAQDLDLISTSQAERLWINCSRRGWRVSEPLDDQLPIEEPRLLRRSFEMLVSEQVQSRAEMRSALPYSATDIEELAGLRTGFFEEQPVVVSLKSFTSMTTTTTTTVTRKKQRQRQNDVVVAFKPRANNETDDIEMMDRKRM